jgi:hypothetical protein
MNARFGRPALASALAVFVALVSEAGRARASDSKNACANAAEEAQALRHDGKLRAARDELLLCARPECPELVKVDCQSWLGEVEDALPTIVVRARDARGHDVIGARVLADGKLLERSLDGKAVALDPGPHHFRFEASGAEPADIDVLVTEGEHNRMVEVTFPVALRADGSRDDGSPATSEHGADGVAMPTTPDARSRDRSSPEATDVASGESIGRSRSLGPWFVGGAGVVALGLFGVLDASAWSDVGAMRDGCGRTRTCNQADVDSVRTRITVAEIALGVGLAAVAGGVTWYVLDRPAGGRPRAQAFVRARPAAGGAAAEAVLAF